MGNSCCRQWGIIIVVDGIFPRHVADAVRSITKHRLNNKQNLALLEIIRRGFEAQQGDLNAVLLEGLEHITAEHLLNTVNELRQRVEAFPKDRPLTPDEAATLSAIVSALASASTAVAFITRNRKKVKPPIHQKLDLLNQSSPVDPYHNL